MSRSIATDILIVSVFALLAFEVHLYTDFVTLPLSISVFLGTAISLILSFNLSHSYERWWEARKIWGEIVNDSRALALQLQTFTSHEEDKVSEIVKYQISWVYLLSNALREEHPDKAVRTHLSREEYSVLENYTHKPLYINTLIKKSMHTLKSLDSYERIQIDSTLMRLVGSMGKAERIKNTVFPKAYQFVLHMSIYLFLGFLSVSLANLGHHWEILLLVFISLPFFMLENTAKHLQDPFSSEPTDVAISSIARNIEINLLTLLEEKNIPQPLEVTDFYLN